MQPQKNSYQVETVGSHMEVAVPVVTPEQTIGEVETLLEDTQITFASINYIYVVDSDRRLTGVLSIKELFSQEPSTVVSTIATRPIVSIQAQADQEQAVLLALKHSIKSVPVVDSSGVFLGVVTSDTILSILHTENVEDALKMAGAQPFDDPVHALMHGSAWLHIKKRLPWLVLGLSGGIFAAFIVHFFEAALLEHVVIAAFIPTVVYMADAVGSQTQMLLIRTLGFNPRMAVVPYVTREVQVNLALAASLGLMMVLITSFGFVSLSVALVLGLAIMSTVVLSMCISLAVPLLFQRYGFDPAVTSGPFATILRDILSLVVYFVIVMALL